MIENRNFSRKTTSREYKPIIPFKNRQILLLLMLLFSATQPLSGEAPELKAKTAIAIDVDTGEILYARNIDEKKYPASITKLMTALLLAENSKPDDIFVYTKSAKSIHPFKLDLKVGEELSARDVMDSILLFSANDIAYLVAEKIGGSPEGFARMMNQKAKELNLTNTHFITPNGLHDESHYSSAYDLSILLRELYKYPWLMESSCKREETIVTMQNTTFTMQNRNKLASTSGCVAGKTGWTSEAGRCLAALFERNQRRIAAVIMDTEYDYRDTVVFNEMLALVDWSFKRQKETVSMQNDSIKIVPVEFPLIPFLPQGPRQNITLSFLTKQLILEYKEDPDFTIEINIPTIDPWNLALDKKWGEVIVTGREILHRYPLYPAISTSDLIKNNVSFYGLTLCLTILAILLLIYLSRVVKKYIMVKKAEELN